MISPHRPTSSLRVLRYRDGAPTRRKDAVAVEEPLEIRLAWAGPAGPEVKPVSVTMRTPGHDFDLSAGFLLTEGIVQAREDVAELTYCQDGPQEYNVVQVRLRPGAAVDTSLFTRNFYTSSSCGVCGKASLEAVEVRGCEVLPAPGEGFRLSATVVPDLPPRLRDAQGVFERTGGLHAAGLFDGEGELQAIMEDVGRHNAVDKVVGEAFLAGRMPLDDRVLVVSGRASFEILQKALVARIPTVVAVGAPSSLAVDLARRFRMTLVGFARDGGFNVYAGEERIA